MTLLTRKDALLLLLLAGLVVLFFWRILTPNSADRAQFPSGDFTDQFYAFRLYEAQALAEGRLPLWSENYNSGHPFLADVQSAVFYPIGLANTLITPRLLGNFPLFALELEALLHFWLAGAFTFLFALRVIGTRAGAFTAALVFTFGGYLTSYPPLQLAILETAAWLPLALLFLDRAATETRGRWGNGGAAGIVLGISALAGHPQTFLFVLLICAAFYAFRTWSILRHQTGARKEWREAALLLLTAVIVGLGIAAAQFIPSFEYQRLSTREALGFREAATGFPTLDLLQFILPGFTSAFASPLYIGVLPLWLGLVALTRREGNRWFWGLLAIGALILAFGFYVFAYAVLYALLPGAGLFREQERLALIVSFALAVLAGFGLSDLLALPGSARKLFVLLPGGAVVSLVLLLVFYVSGLGQSSGRLAFLGDRAGLMLLLFGLASLLVAAFLYGWITPRVLVGLASIFILFDLFSINEPANKGPVVERYPPNSLIDLVRADSGIWRVADEGQFPGHFGIAYGLEEIGGISPLRLAHYAALLELEPARLWRVLNVKYVFSARDNIPSADRLGQEGKTGLVRVRDVLPRAFLVGKARVESDDSVGLALMQSPDFDSGKVALLATPPPFPPVEGAEAGSVNVELRRPERLVLGVTLPLDGLLVVSENYYPGWTARVDGAPVEILRADLSLRGLPVRAGTHRIEFVFDPLSVKLGIAVSLLTLILAVGAIAWSVRVA